MATITFFTRFTNPDKKVNVRVRFRHGKKINIYAKSGLELLPRQFSNETHTINKQSKYTDKPKDKKYLDGLESAILEAYKDIKGVPTSDWLKSIIDKHRFPDNYKLESETLFSFIQNFIDKDRINPKTNKPVWYFWPGNPAKDCAATAIFCSLTRLLYRRLVRPWPNTSAMTSYTGQSG